MSIYPASTVCNSTDQVIATKNDGDNSFKSNKKKKKKRHKRDLHSNGSGFGSNSDEPLNRIVRQGGRLMRESMTGRLRIMFVYIVNY
jgi:hypothetical protein